MWDKPGGEGIIPAVNLPRRAAMTVSVRSGSLSLTAVCCRAGADLTVTVTGGDRPHVGCVVVAHPHEATDGSGRTSVTCSVLCNPPHREEPLARPLAETLARELRATVAVTAGVHTDGLTDAGVAAYLRLGERLAERLLRRLDR